MTTTGVARPEIIIHLVPGTFARDARWCQDGSKLRKAVQSRFEDRALVYTHDWSTDNAHLARRSGGAHVADRLRSLTDAHRDAAHYIVAHSHGGNVASYALGDIILQERVSGVVYLGTPHLRARPRDLMSTLTFGILALAPILFLVASIPMLLIGATILAVLGTMWTSAGIPTAVILLAAVLGGTAVLTFMLHRRCMHWAFDRVSSLEERQFETVTRIEPMVLARTPTLNVGTPLDEAAWYLRTLRWLAGLPFWLWRPHWMTAALLLVYGVLGLILVLGIVPEAVMEVANANLPELGIPSAIGYLFALTAFVGVPALIAASIALLLQGLMLTFPRVIRASVLGFGGESLVDNLLVDISVADQPRAAHVETVSRWLLPARGSRFFGWRTVQPALAHCLLYDDDRMIDRVLEWIASKPALSRSVVVGLPSRRALEFPLGL